MKVDFILVGQGVCGTFLAWELRKNNRSFVIIDDSKPETASKVASGIINPITGRRMVKTWMIDDLMPFAVDAYSQIGKALGVSCFERIDSIDCFPTAQMRLAFLERLEAESNYLAMPVDEQAYFNYLNYDLGYGIIDPCYLADLQTLLPAFRNSLASAELLEEWFNIDLLTRDAQGVHYKDVHAAKIIFCDGRGSVDNPYFRNLPFALSKGEALIVDIPGLPRNHIYKKGISLVPWNNGLFWAGSSYEWNFEHDRPTELFRERMVNQLTSFLKLPFTITGHIASLRPGTLERRPFVGWHPLYPDIGILNGMGTKGCSLAPYFARQFADHITADAPILPAADIKRFVKVLSRDL